MNRRLWMVLGVPLWACAAATGCGQARSMPAASTPVAVYDMPVLSDVTDREEFPGSTEAIYSVQVRARHRLYDAGLLQGRRNGQ